MSSGSRPASQARPKKVRNRDLAGHGQGGFCVLRDNPEKFWRPGSQASTPRLGWGARLFSRPWACSSGIPEPWTPGQHHKPDQKESIIWSGWPDSKAFCVSSGVLSGNSGAQGSRPAPQARLKGASNRDVAGQEARLFGQGFCAYSGVPCGIQGPRPAPQATLKGTHNLHLVGQRARLFACPRACPSGIPEHKAPG